MKNFRQKLRILAALGIVLKNGSPWDLKRDGFPRSGTDGGIHPETCRLWLKGDGTPSEKSLEVIAAFINRNVLGDDKALGPEKMLGSDLSDDAPMERFLKKIGKSEAEAQKFLFSSHFGGHSPHLQYLFETVETASSHLRAHKGYYHIFRLQSDGAGRPLIVRMGMAVLSIEKVTGRSGVDRHVIAGALSVPSVHDDGVYHYTGVICATQKLMTYNFAQDEEALPDFAILMAGGASDDEHSQRSGHMLTVKQNGDLTQPVSYPIVIRRINRTGGLSGYQEFLADAASMNWGIADAKLRQALGIGSKQARRKRSE